MNDTAFHCQLCGKPTSVDPETYQESAERCICPLCLYAKEIMSGGDFREYFDRMVSLFGNNEAIKSNMTRIQNSNQKEPND